MQSEKDFAVICDGVKKGMTQDCHIRFITINDVYELGGETILYLHY